jgi:hypothetical protein
MVGSSAGVPVMLAAIQAQLDGPALPKRTARIRHAGFPPDQNAAPDIAYILHPLGLTRDQRALSIWQQIVDRLAPVSVDEIVDKEFSTYYYVAEVCFGAERLADPAAIPLLKQLHSYAPFHQHVHTTGMQADYLQERIAYLELIIGRALWQPRWLCDSHKLLARSARNHGRTCPHRVNRHHGAGLWQRPSRMGRVVGATRGHSTASALARGD